MKRPFAAALAAICAACVFWAAGTADAALSASGAFVLIRKVAPGDEFSDAAKFLGQHASERSSMGGKRMKITRWGSESDEWIFDVLHDGETVRATRIIWNTRTKRDQQTIFSQLTSEGRKYFGRAATFDGFDQAEWKELGGKLLVQARIEPEITQGVTLLTGIRNDEKESLTHGF